jgi:hypothetical protein
MEASFHSFPDKETDPESESTMRLHNFFAGETCGADQSPRENDSALHLDV